MKQLARLLTMTVLVALFFLWSAAPAAAETVTLYPSADTFVYNQFPDHVYIDDSELDLMHLSDGKRAHSFVLFNLDSIPAGSRIDSAVLRLYVDLRTSHNYNIPISRCTEAWPSSLTWNNQPSVTGPVTETLFSAPEHSWQNIDLTGLVQGWINGDYPNFGFKIGIPIFLKDTAMLTWRIPSKEGLGNWPTLEINYAPPAASGSETETTSPSTTGTSPGSIQPITSAPATGSQITKVKADKIKMSSAYITWTTDVDSNSYVDYGKTDKYDKATGKDDMTNTHSVQLIELKPDTTYHFRVKSTNADGHQVVSKDYTFRTAEQPKAEEDKSNVWLWVAIGGLCLLVLVLGGVLIFLYIRNRRRKNSRQKSET